MERLSPETFRLPIEKIRAGYKSDVYFNRTREILQRDGHRPTVTMQVFQKNDGVTVCGVDHSLAILHAGAGYYKDQERADRLFARYLELEKKAYSLWLNLRNVNWEDYEAVNRELFEVSKELDFLWVSKFKDLSIKALRDGDPADAWEPVMHIEGDLSDFVHLETLYLGALTDGTCVATNTRKAVEAVGGKPVLMFGARHKSHESQAGDGYAAFVGGAQAVSTHEQGEYWGSKGIGTMPHALIAAYGGDTVLATLKFEEHINGTEHKVNTVSLVDFDNDSVATSVSVAKALGGKLWGVRLDTSERLIDKAVWEEIQKRARPSSTKLTGVNPLLVELTRKALDAEGFGNVKIVVSGGFTDEKIRMFEEREVPADAYGIGSFLFAGSGGQYDYTADIVRPVTKVGRGYIKNPRLKKVNIKEYLK